MKTVVAIILAVVLLTAIGCDRCDNNAEKNKGVVLAAFEAMNNHEYDKLDQYFAVDFCRYSQATPEAEVTSLDDMKVFMKEWYSAFPDAQMELQKIAAEGDLVAAWVTFAGTHEGQMGPYAATGKTMVSETFGFFRLEDGLIKESWVTWDNLAGLAQLGLFPPPMPGQSEEEE